MAKAKLNQVVPEFTLPATSGKQMSLSDLSGQAVVLYFYPKDNTPGCTLEGQDFRRLHKQFMKRGCQVFGVSRDSIKSHENFKAKCDFPFELLSDVDEKVCRLFDVIRMKKLYGREYLGVDRSTFILDHDHVLRREWRGVKVKGHADEVLAFVKTNFK